MRYEGFEYRGAMIVQDDAMCEIVVLARHIPTDEDHQVMVLDYPAERINAGQAEMLAQIYVDAINRAAFEEAKATGRADPL